MSAVYSLDNVVFTALLKYGGLSLLKLVLMTPIIAIYRYFASGITVEESVTGTKIRNKSKQFRPRLERFRAAHLNDLENIVPFILLSLLYVATKPDLGIATYLFKVFAFARVIHTVAYLKRFRQTIRRLTYMPGIFVNVYMAMHIVRAVL